MLDQLSELMHKAISEKHILSDKLLVQFHVFLTFSTITCMQKILFARKYPSIDLVQFLAYFKKHIYSIKKNCMTLHMCHRAAECSYFKITSKLFQLRFQTSTFNQNIRHAISSPSLKESSNSAVTFG